LHYGAVHGGSREFSGILDRFLLVKREEKNVSCKILRKVSGGMTCKRLRRKMTNYDAIIMRINDSSNAYTLDSSFEMKYFASLEYKKSKESFINARDNSGHTALHVAAFNNNIKGVKMLLRYNACPFIKDLQESVTVNFN
jgi:ankyrin repeat protein